MSAIHLAHISQLTERLNKIINDVNPIDWYSEAATADLNAYLESIQQQYELSKTKIQRHITEISQYADEWQQSLKSSRTTQAELTAYNEAVKDPQGFFSAISTAKDIIDEINANFKIIDTKLRSTSTAYSPSITQTTLNTSNRNDISNP
ncbi:unnamed protein product [Anisakis simplex]|uniref:WXG100 family type VII secretion target n=1 Tax=Anisakis simplex TaxID=6269 RepID=A0A0M3K0E0_ANISI|nr:unnamed protein product [Anisakis simplex]